MNKGISGFSLLDLLVTLTLFSLFAIISIPKGQSPGKDIKKFTHVVEELLERARGIALYEDSRVTLLLKPDSLELRNENKIVEKVNVPATLSVTSSNDTFYFLSQGTTTPASLIISGPTGECRLTIALLGRVRRKCS